MALIDVRQFENGSFCTHTGNTYNPVSHSQFNIFKQNYKYAQVEHLFNFPPQEPSHLNTGTYRHSHKMIGYKSKTSLIMYIHSYNVVIFICVTLIVLVNQEVFLLNFPPHIEIDLNKET